MAKKILWNEEALKQGADELGPNEVRCPDCGESPQLRQFGRYFCECGKLEGATRRVSMSLTLDTSWLFAWSALAIYGTFINFRAP